MSKNPNSTIVANGRNFVSTIHTDPYAFIDPTQFDLSGKAVFITGASKGIGRATATSFARAGASYIALGARSDLSAVEQELQEISRQTGQRLKVLALKLDVTDEQSVAAAAKELSLSFSRLDILVNNAGFLEPWVPLVESDPAEWWRTWEINIKGTYLVTRAVVPLMTTTTKEGLKTVLNVSSYGAHGLNPGASAYQTTKLATIRLAEFFNVDYGGDNGGLLSFAVHPGSVRTELAHGMPEYMLDLLTDTPEMCADAIVWLTAERRDWLAGRFVSVTWDMKELLEKKDQIVKDDLLKVRLDAGLGLE